MDRKENYLLPFFWQRGESEEKIREYVGVIQDAGCSALCMEARPHPDFAGEKWWQDVAVVLDECRKREMKVWILDDAHFPTGMAAGAMEDADASLCRQYLNYQKYDICGPMPQTEIRVEEIVQAASRPRPYSGLECFLGEKEKRVFDDSYLYAVTAAPLKGKEEKDDGNLLGNDIRDLTGFVEDGKLLWDVPEGKWRIFVIYVTRNNGGRADYIHMMDPKSCRVLIDAVYEPHYAHFKDEFGKTLAGFFSDEACIGNHLLYTMDEMIGKKDMPLPFGSLLEERLKGEWGENMAIHLSALWSAVEDETFTAVSRCTYMNHVTRLVQKNFSEQLGDWCRAHKVQYIGHIIEDNGQHTRLGNGCGHFFRALWGQDMAGIDNIGGQVERGGQYHQRVSRFFPGGDGEFYHFALGKLGTSLAHLDKKKQGRCLCEIFGNYGWKTGVREMKYMADHFLVRGVNYFVPHAFSMKDFPDPDCPPHFYANGENPQYEHFGELMRYVNRVCGLLNGGLHVPQAAVLYHAEAEWAGGDCMPVEKPARELLENQIDFDFVPADIFTDREGYHTDTREGLCVNHEQFRCLVIPETSFLTKATAQFICHASEIFWPVIFLESYPTGLCDGTKEEWESYEGVIRRCPLLPLAGLSEYLTKLGIREISPEKEFAGLRYYHYETEEYTLYLFSNEDESESFSGKIRMPALKKPYYYDAWEDTRRQCLWEDQDGMMELDLTLHPYESVILMEEKASHSDEKNNQEEKLRISDRQLTFRELPESFRISLKECRKDGSGWTFIEEISKLRSISLIAPDFSGFIRYESKVYAEPDENVLMIGDAWEGVKVWINGKYLGMRICPPYVFDAEGIIQNGENEICIEVATTAERKARKIRGQEISAFEMVPIGPTGITGKIKLGKDRIKKRRKYEEHRL